MPLTDPYAPQSGPLLSQTSTRALDGDRWVDPDLVRHARHLAARGSVLLRNEGALPLAEGERVALFGRMQKDWLAVGYGSGGDVNPPYCTTLVDSLREGGRVEIDEGLAELYETWCAQNPAEPGDIWGQWPMSYPEMEIEDEVVRRAAERSRIAVIVLGRAAGEDRENVLEEGSFYLTSSERRLLAQVTDAFERTVVIVDTGGLIDFSWLLDYKVDALLLAWFGGMEGGRAIADVLTGVVEPGGRLTDTIAVSYEANPSARNSGDPEGNDYVEDIYVGYRWFETLAPQDVLFPFGFGLGYTTFEQVASVEGDSGEVRVKARVRNTGARRGSDVVQVYLEAPSGALSTPSRQLVGFARTDELEPGAVQELEIPIPQRSLASYDDSGATGHRSAWVLQAGEHRFHVGADVRSAQLAGAVHVPDLVVLEQLEAAAGPRSPFERMVIRSDAAEAVDGETPVLSYEPVPLAPHELRARIVERLPEPVHGTREPESAGSAGAGGAASVPSFTDVVAGRSGLEDFVASLAPRELAALTYGDIIMDSPLGPAGNAGALGGVTEELRDRGIPAAITTDGPSGLRLAAYASLLPCGTSLASTWDPEGVESMAALHAQEMIRKGSDILLSPGMNIHRDPLCGRNFEYFSEDPLLTGSMAVAVVRGVQSQGVSACPKHFAANNQETNRTYADSRVSERALREIYLRGFEQVVREAAPRTIMTSYNRINGVWGHYHYDLVTTILRGQWGYEGLVVTDWWMQMAPDPDFPALRDSAYRVRAGVDVLMPGGREHWGTDREDSVVESWGEPGGITLAEMQACARRVLEFLLEARIADRERHPQAKV